MDVVLSNSSSSSSSGNEIALKIIWFFCGVTHVVVSAENNLDFSAIHAYTETDTNFTVTILGEISRLKNEGENGFIVDLTSGGNVEELLDDFTSAAKQYEKIVVVSATSSRDLVELYEETVTRKNLTRTVLYATQEDSFVAHNKFRGTTKRFAPDQRDDLRRFLSDNDYYGYTISATLFESIPSAFEQGGVDFCTLDTVARVSNLTIAHFVPTGEDWFGNVYPNGTMTGSLKDLHDGSSQIAFNQMFIKDYGAPKLEFSRVVISDRLCVVVRKLQRIGIDFAPLGLKVKILNVALFVAYTLVLVAIRKLNRLKLNVETMHSSDDPGFLATVVDVLQTVFSTPRQKKPNFYYEKLVIGFGLMYSLMNSAFYQSALATAITKPPPPQQIDTLEALAKSPLTIYTYSENLGNTFSQSNLPYMRVLSDKLTVFKYTSLDYESHGYLSREEKFEFVKTLDIKSYGRVDYHLVKECPSTYLLAYMFRKDFFFAKRFNEILGRLVDGGLIDKWQADVMVTASLKHSPGNSTQESPPRIGENRIRILTVQEVRSIFQILLAGLLASVFVFVAELFMKMRKDCRVKNERT